MTLNKAAIERVIMLDVAIESAPLVSAMIAGSFKSEISPCAMSVVVFGSDFRAEEVAAASSAAFVVESGLRENSMEEDGACEVSGESASSEEDEDEAMMGAACEVVTGWVVMTGGGIDELLGRIAGIGATMD